MRRSAFTILELLLVMAIVATSIGLLIPAVLKVRKAAARTQTSNLLMQLALGLQNCDAMHSGLPPATGEFGNPPVIGTVHVHLLPFIEQDLLYQKIVAGTAPHLKTVSVPQFVSPLDPMFSIASTNFAFNLRVLSDLGLTTQWDATISPDGDGNDPKTKKPWYFGTARIPQSLPDGTSNTIAIATQYTRCGTDWGFNFYATSAGVKNNSPFFGYYAPQAKASADRGVGNGRTGEIFQIQPTVKDCNPSYTPQSLLPSALTVGMFDGSVRAVVPSLDVTIWGKAVQPNDGLPLGHDWIQ